jgi:hypothetical protein
MHIEDQARRIDDRQSFVRFLHALGDDAAQHPDEWQHAELASYLHAVADWTEDMGAVLAQQAKGDLTWKQVGQLFVAGRGYD